MVAIDQGSALPQDGLFHISRLRGWAIIASVTALVGIGGFAVRGFSENGLRLGSELAWRFTCFVFFAAIIAGPLARLIPSQTLHRICEQRRQLIWGFCASFGVYLASVLVPNLLAHRDDLTAGMTTFVMFGAGLIVIIGYTASRQAADLLGETARRTILVVGLSTFWLAYALTGLAYISGPHRPDAFYGFSLSLMIAALLLRFADRFAANIRSHGRPA
ncbi:MAG: hypothetical protein ABI963_12875 [Rhizomicrobium sp.]